MTDVASVDIPAAQELLVVVVGVVGVVELVVVDGLVVVVGVLVLLLLFGLLELVVGLVVAPVVGDVLALSELPEPSVPEPVVVVCCEPPLLPLG